MTEFQRQMMREAEAMADMQRAGKTNTEIAAVFHCTNDKVARRLAKVGITASGSMRRRIREEHGDEVMFLGDLGYTADEIGDRLGVSSALIRTVFKELGYTPPKRNTSRMHEKFVKETKAEAEKMRAMSESGMTDAEIAAEFGVCKNTVRARIKRTGLVRDQEWKHAQLVEKAEKDAEAANVELLEEPLNHKAVIRYLGCGHEATVDYTTSGGFPSCPECRSIESEKRREIRQRERERRLAAPSRAESAEATRKRVAVWKLCILLTPRTCKQCGKVFHSKRRGVTYCSKMCRRKANKNNHVRRARKYGVEHDIGITLRKLVDRDGLTCYICGKTCDWNDRRWGCHGPDYPSIDHVIPLSRGGRHAWDNIRVACVMCNAEKRDIILDGVHTGGNRQVGTAAAAPHNQKRD